VQAATVIVVLHLLIAAHLHLCLLAVIAFAHKPAYCL
jgi:hypothetical protein